MSIDTTSRILAPFLDRFTAEELDAIPYGVVQLDLDGRVLTYNRAEAENADVMPRPLGQHFFFEVAPSANVPEFYGRFLEGVSAQHLDDTFRFTFSCALMPRRVMLRQYFSRRTGSVWLFIGRPDGSAFTWNRAVHSLTALRTAVGYGADAVAGHMS